MVKSMFAAVAGLRAHQTKMDVISNNIANVNTYGYKSARATFSDVYYATTSGASSSGETYGGTNPSQIGYGSKISSIDSNMSSGGSASTDEPLDCMIINDGFFVVGEKLAEDSEGIILNTETTETAVEGSSTTEGALTGLNLTRVGNFKWDEDGYLVDANGMCVYGFSVGDDDTIDTGSLAPIRKANALGDDATSYTAASYNSVTIGTDGTITGIAKTTVDGKETETATIIGQIGLANVTNPNALERTSNGYYMAKNNTGTITVNQSGENGTGTMKSGFLEMSNVDLSKEFTEMITCQRGYQANTRIITVTDTLLEELVNLKR